MSVIGFIGVGQLGAPTVECLAAAGHEVRVHVRRDEVRARFAGRPGVVVCTSPAEAANGAEFVVVFLFSGDQVLSVLANDPGPLTALGPGGLVVVHTTMALPEVRRLAEVARGFGVSVVDAPVSGTAADIRAGRLTVLVGTGQDADWDRCRSVLMTYADPVIRVGGVGDATAVKLVNNLVFAAQVQVVAAARGLASHLGLDPELALEAIRRCSGDSAALGHLVAVGLGRAGVSPGLARYLGKDVAACRATARELGVDLGFLESVVKSGPVALG